MVVFHRLVFSDNRIYSVQALSSNKVLGSNIILSPFYLEFASFVSGFPPDAPVSSYSLKTCRGTKLPIGVNGSAFVSVLTYTLVIGFFPTPGNLISETSCKQEAH